MTSSDDIKPRKKRGGRGVEVRKPGQRPAGSAEKDIPYEPSTTCPKLHPLPNKTDQGNCTALYCALDPVVIPKIPSSTELAKRGDELDQVPSASVSREEEMEAEEDAAGQAEELRIRRGMGRHRAMVKALQVPAGLEGKAAEEWADKKAISLLPDAMAELEFQLKFGNDKQRAEAAKEVREMTGRGKRDMTGGGGPTIILVGSSDGQNPFLKRVDVPALKGDK